MSGEAVAGSGLVLSRDKAGKPAARLAARACPLSAASAEVRPVAECGMYREGCECVAGSRPVRD